MVIDNRSSATVYDAKLLSETLSAEGLAVPVSLYSEVASTNLTAKEAAKAGAQHGSAFLAESQNAGRGRLGKSFYSPPGNGIYLSMVLRPALDENSILRLTTAVSVAVCRAVERICRTPAQIKWVNDIYLHGRKLCGILCEGVLGNQGLIESVVCGIGVNFYSKAEDFPEEIRHTACSLYEVEDPDVSREALAAALIREVISCIDTLADGGYLDEYRKRSFLLGKEILLLNKTDPERHEPVTALAVGIDDLGGLIVRLQDGSTQALHTGDVSIRLR